MLLSILPAHSAHTLLPSCLFNSNFISDWQRVHRNKKQ